jgi:hypothetical protein
MTENVPGIADLVKAPDSPDDFDVYHPGNVSPFVAWLARADCAVSGRVFYVKGGQIGLYEGWHHEPLVTSPARWTVADLGDALNRSRLAGESAAV